MSSRECFCKVFVSCRLGEWICGAHTTQSSVVDKADPQRKCNYTNKHESDIKCEVECHKYSHISKPYPPMGSRLSIAGLFSWAFPRENDDKQIPGPRAAAGTILRRTALQRKERAIAMELRRLRESPKRLLDNPRLWPHDREKWIGVQVLGQGAFGTASLWEFVGDGSPEDDANPLLGKLVVLKTGINHPSTVDLFEEGKIMKWLMKRNDSHLVRLVYNFDDSLFNKIYMEYCRFGDLAAEIRRRRSCKSPWSEKELWKMFYCLAKACQTMAKVEGGHNSLLHMDLKPHNILLCESGLDDHECPGGFIQYKVSC